MSGVYPSSLEPALPRRRALHWGLACAIGATGLAGRQVQACEFSTALLRVTHPWTRATPEGAHSAIVCMKFDEVVQDERLIGIETNLATGAEMAGVSPRKDIDFFIPQGLETLLSESGSFIRLTGLLQPLQVGHAYPIQLLFEKAGTLRANLTVDYERFR